MRAAARRSGVQQRRRNSGAMVGANRLTFIANLMCLRRRLHPDAGLQCHRHRRHRRTLTTVVIKVLIVAAPGDANTEVVVPRCALQLDGVVFSKGERIWGRWW